MKLPHQRILSLLVFAVLPGCDGGVVDPGLGDSGAAEMQVTWPEGGTPSDTGVTLVDARPGVDLTSTPGQPCTLGKCADGLICMANICRAICSGECGEKAPECTGDEGCYWVTSFSAACLPGSAGYLEPCGEGVWCKGGLLCVAVSGHPSRCLKLCQYGCPPGVPCGSTSNGCRVCIQ